MRWLSASLAALLLVQLLFVNARVSALGESGEESTSEEASEESTTAEESSEDAEESTEDAEESTEDAEESTEDAAEDAEESTEDAEEESTEDAEEESTEDEEESTEDEEEDTAEEETEEESGGEDEESVDLSSGASGDAMNETPKAVRDARREMNKKQADPVGKAIENMLSGGAKTTQQGGQAIVNANKNQVHIVRVGPSPNRDDGESKVQQQLRAGQEQEAKHTNEQRVKTMKEEQLKTAQKERETKLEEEEDEEFRKELRMKNEGTKKKSEEQARKAELQKAQDERDDRIRHQQDLEHVAKLEKLQQKHVDIQRAAFNRRMELYAKKKTEAAAKEKQEASVKKAEGKHKAEAASKKGVEQKKKHEFATKQAARARTREGKVKVWARERATKRAEQSRKGLAAKRKEQAAKAQERRSKQPKWKLVGRNVCFGAQSGAGTFHISGRKFIQAIRLQHTTGRVTCHYRYWSNWGCHAKNRMLGVMITRGKTEEAVPNSNTRGYSRYHNAWYRMSGYVGGSSNLYFRAKSNWLLIQSSTTRYYVHYLEALKRYTVGDNRGRSCANVYALMR